MSPYLIAAVAIVALLLLRALLTRRHPKAPPTYKETPFIPWLGSVVQFAMEPQKFLRRAHDKAGEMFSIRLFGSHMTFLFGSEGHEFFFMQPEETFNISKAYKFTVTTFGPGICYDCPPKKMYQQFGFFRYGLADRQYAKYVDLIQHECEQYFDAKWGDSGEMCLFTALNELFTLTSSRCLMGPEIRAQWKAEYGALYQDLDKSFIPINFFFPNMPNPYKNRCINARTRFEAIFKGIMADRKKDQKSSESYDDFLQVLLDSEYKHDHTCEAGCTKSHKLTTAEITGIMMGVLLGGQHTSNVTGTWLALHLLQDDKWLQQVIKEQSTLVRGPARLDYEGVKQMPVFDAVLKETLRLHPPFFMLARSVMKDIEFKGKIIPAGDFVAISPGVAQRLPSMWADNPDGFDPARFMVSDEVEKARPKHSFIAFSGGHHTCTGRKFAQVSIKTALAWLFRRYELEFPQKDLPRPDYTTMVIAPTHPVKVRYTRRKY